MTHQKFHGLNIWDWPVLLEQTAFGIAVGAFIIAVVLDIVGKGRFRSYSKLGFILAAPLSIIGLITLVLELGRPERAANAILNLLVLGTSVMSATVPILMAFVVASIITLLLWIKPDAARPVRQFFQIIGLLVAIPAGMQAGLLLQAAFFRPLWISPVFPYLYLISALLMGIGVIGLAMVRRAYEELRETIFSMFGYTILLLIVQTAALIGHLAMVNAPIEVPALFTNPFPLYAPTFIVGTLIIGMAFPAVISFQALRVGSLPSRGVATILFIFLIIGAIALRAAFLYTGQIV